MTAADAIVAALTAVVVVTSVGFTWHEWRWLRRVERASGDPEALRRLLGPPHARNGDR